MSDTENIRLRFARLNQPRPQEPENPCPGCDCRRRAQKLSTGGRRWCLKNAPGRQISIVGKHIDFPSVLTLLTWVA